MNNSIEFLFLDVVHVKPMNQADYVDKLSHRANKMS